MFCTQQPELFLIVAPSVMSFLVVDVVLNITKVGMAYREHSIAMLPRETVASTRGGFGPFRCLRFDNLDQFADWQSSRESNQKVNVINVPSDLRDDATRFLGVIRKHTQHLISKFSVLEKRRTILGRKDHMQPNLGKRLRHIELLATKRNNVGPLALEHQLYDKPSPLGWARKTIWPLAQVSLSSRHRGRRPCLQLVVVAAWLGVCVTAFGQEENSLERLRVPVRALKAVQSDTQMIAFPGFVSSKATVAPLAHYQRSRLGRWDVERDVDADDSVFGIELNTPVGPIRIRYEVTIDEKSFRADREETIDDLLMIARGEKQNPEADDVSQNRARIVAYAKSRGDRANRYELRRRIADLAGGPSLLWISRDFAADRNETHILFALLDANEDGTISSAELEELDKVFDHCDMNSDNRIDLTELHSRLKPRSARRKSSSAKFDWQSWDVNRSEHVEDLSVSVTFNESEKTSKLLLDDCSLTDPWKSVTAEMSRIDAPQESCGQALLMSHPNVTIALTAEEETKASGQVSVGVMAEGNALFRHLDQDGNWNLTRTEIDDGRDRLLELDRNSDQEIEVTELPVLLRVSVARGEVAYRSLQEHVAFVSTSEDAEDTKEKLTPPEWFVSMDQDGDRTLSRTEFLGGRDAFERLDGDSNQRISVEEALSP